MYTHIYICIYVYMYIYKDLLQWRGAVASGRPNDANIGQSLHLRWSLAFGVWGFGLRVKCAGFRVWG